MIYDSVRLSACLSLRASYPMHSVSNTNVDTRVLPRYSFLLSQKTVGHIVPAVVHIVDVVYLIVGHVVAIRGNFIAIHVHGDSFVVPVKIVITVKKRMSWNALCLMDQKKQGRIHGYRSRVRVVRGHI